MCDLRTYILTSPALLHMCRCMPMLACSLCLQTERRYFLPRRSSWLSTKLPNKSKFEYNLGCELWLFSVPRSSRLKNLWQQKTYKTSKVFRGSTLTPLPSNPEDSWKLITADIFRKSGNWGVKAPFQHATPISHVTCCFTLHGFMHLHATVLANGNCPGHLQVCKCHMFWYVLYSNFSVESRTSQMILTKTSMNPQWELFEHSFGNNVLFNAPAFSM